MMSGMLLDASPTPLPNSLSEKLDYQIYQTRLLTGIVEDNRLALKRLVGMMSHLLDNSGQSPANDSSHIDSSLDEKKKPVPTSSNLPQSKSDLCRFWKIHSDRKPSAVAWLTVRYTFSSFI